MVDSSGISKHDTRLLFDAEMASINPSGNNARNRISASAVNTSFCNDSQIFVYSNSTGNKLLSNSIQTKMISQSPFNGSILLSGKRITIADYDKKKQTRFNFPSMENSQVQPTVDYCSWKTEDNLILCTDQGVFSLDISSTKIQLIFNSPKFSTHETITFSSNPQMSCFALTLSPRDSQSGRKCGIVYSKKTEKVSINECDLVTIIPSLDQRVNLIVFASKVAGNSVKLDISGFEANSHTIVHDYFFQRTLSLQPGSELVNIFKCPKKQIIYLISSNGQIDICDQELKIFFTSYKIENSSSIFFASPNVSDEGIIFISSDKKVYSSKIDSGFLKQSLDKIDTNKEFVNKIIPTSNVETSQNNLDDTKLIEFLDNNQVDEAVKYAINSPGGILRTSKTLSTFISHPKNSNEAVKKYLKTAHSSGGINEEEFIWLINLSKKNTSYSNSIKNCIDTKKVQMTEKIGDALYKASPNYLNMAIDAYKQCSSHHKICASLCLRDPNDLPSYMEKYLPNEFNMEPTIRTVSEFDGILLNAVVKYALTSTSKIVRSSLNDVFKNIYKSPLLGSCVELLLDEIENQGPTAGLTELEVLECSIAQDIPKTMELLKNGKFKKINESRVKNLLEKNGQSGVSILFERNIQELLKKLDKMDTVLPIETMEILLESKTQQERFEIIEMFLNSIENSKFDLGIDLMTKFHSKVNFIRLCEVLLNIRQSERLFELLRDFSKDNFTPEISVIFTSLCLQLDKIDELRKIINTYDNLDVEKIKQMLISPKFRLQEFVSLCDRFDLITDLVTQLADTQEMNYLLAFAQKMRPKKLPQIVEVLVTRDFSEADLKKLIDGTKTQYSFLELYHILDSANKADVMRSILEYVVHNNTEDKEAHTALALYYIKSNISPEKFLKANALYDPMIAGDYALNNNPRMACLAYQKGKLDDKIIEVCENYHYFDALTLYCIEKDSAGFWDRVILRYLSNDLLIDSFTDQFLQTLAESQDLTAVQQVARSITLNKKYEYLHKVLHFLVVECPSNLIANHPEFQTTLIKTSITHHPEQVMNYIKTLQFINPQSLKKSFIEAEMYEEAFEMFKIHNLDQDGMSILVNYIKDLSRARRFAEEIKNPNAKIYLAVALLETDYYDEAIQIFMDNKNFTLYNKVIEFGVKNKRYKFLLKFLLTARNTVYDPIIDTHIPACYAFMGNDTEIKSFLSSETRCDINKAGDVCLDNNLLNAAFILFKYISNYSKLAKVCLMMENFDEAIKFAEKTNNHAVMFEICTYCLHKGHHLYAVKSANYLFSAHYQMPALIEAFESEGLFIMLCDSLEQATRNSQAQASVYQHYLTAIAKYRPENLLPSLPVMHLKVNNKSELVKTFIRTANYAAASLLEELTENYDQAIEIVIQYPAQAWNHTKVIQIVSKLRNFKVIKDLFEFYLAYAPEYISDIYVGVVSKTDHKLLLNILGSQKYLALTALERFNSSQDSTVINALIEIYSQTGNKQKLKQLISRNKNFSISVNSSEADSSFSDVAAISARQNKNYRSSFQISKTNNVLSDTPNLVVECNDAELIYDILDWLITFEDKSYFIGCLNLAHEQISGSRATMLGWKHNCSNLVAPYTIFKLGQIEEKLSSIQTSVNGISGVQKNRTDNPMFDKVASNLMLE